MEMNLTDALNEFEPKEETELLIGYDENGGLKSHHFRKGSLLVAGITGSGKTITIHQLILSGMFNWEPQSLQFALYDPKQVEYGVYKDSPHLLGGIMTKHEEFSEHLKCLKTYVEERADIFNKIGVHNIDGYNKYAKENDVDVLPNIITIVDEMAEFTFRASDYEKELLANILQKSSPFGIHFVIGTQTPRKEVITGQLRALVDNRLVMMVANDKESHLMMGEAGAELLEGKGQFYYINSDRHKSDEILQSTFVSDENVRGLCDYFESENSKYGK